MVERLGSQLIQVFAAEGDIFDTLPTFFRCLRGLVLQVVVGEGIAEILFFLGRVRITRRMELRVVAYSPLCGGNANLTVLPKWERWIVQGWRSSSGASAQFKFKSSIAPLPQCS